jgi:hypothetical protein
MNAREASRGALWFAIGLVVAAAAFFLLRPRQPPAQAIPVVRSYVVRPEIANEMRNALSDAFGMTLWKVSVTSDGRLLVNAPESVQKGVESLLADVAAKKPAPTPSIQFEVWMVSAVPGSASAADSAAALADVSAALVDIQKARGPLRFELIEKLALHVQAGDDGEMQGARSEMRIVPTVRNDDKGDPVIAAKVSVKLMPRANGAAQGSLRALTELRPSQFLVIGQSSLPGKGAPESAPDGQVYYIVRATL